QSVPGFCANAVSATGVVPLKSQMPTWPLLFCQAISVVPLKDPVLTACHDGSPTLIDTDEVTLVPFMMSTIRFPLMVFCSRMSSRPPVLKSAPPPTFRVGPGLPMPAWAIGVVPFISQPPSPPLDSCQMRSPLPSPLRSPLATRCQLAP